MPRLPWTPTLVLLLLGLCNPSPSAATSADTLCSSSHQIAFWATLSPPDPCALGQVSLVVHDFKTCDHILSGTYSDGGAVYLEFASKEGCLPPSPCQAESLIVPLGSFWPGAHQLQIWSRAVVDEGASGDCLVGQADSISFTVGSCPPPSFPRGPLPMISEVRIGRQAVGECEIGLLKAPPLCEACPPIACAGESIRVFARGRVPNSCKYLERVDLIPLPFSSPSPQPPVLQIDFVDEECPDVGCLDMIYPFCASVELPPLPVGSYKLVVQERIESFCFGTRMFCSSFPFEVASGCGGAQADGRSKLVIAAPEPNPFARETRLSLTVPAADAGLIEATVHDLAGRRVARVVGVGVATDLESAGAVNITLGWSGTDDAGNQVRDGVYFVHVRAGNAEFTRKIILLRGK